MKYLLEGEKPTRAINKALDEHNNSRSINEGISIRTAWYKYKKIKEKMVQK